MSEFSYEQMLELVGEDVRGNLTQNMRAQLHQDQYLDLRYSALVSLKQSVESQLTSNKSRTHKARVAFELGLSTKEIDPSDEENYSFESEEEFATFMASRTNWRVKAVRFLKAIEKDIIAVKSRRQQLYQQTESANKIYTLGTA